MKPTNSMVQWCYQVITKRLRSARRGVSLISVFNLTDGQIERRSDSRWTNWQTKWLTSGRMNQFRFPVKPWWGRGILRRQKKGGKNTVSWEGEEIESLGISEFIRPKPRLQFIIDQINIWRNADITTATMPPWDASTLTFWWILKKRSPSLSSARLLLPHPLGSFWTTHFFFTKQPTPFPPSFS